MLRWAASSSDDVTNPLVCVERFLEQLFRPAKCRPDPKFKLKFGKDQQSCPRPFIDGANKCSTQKNSTPTHKISNGRKLNPSDPFRLLCMHEPHITHVWFKRLSVLFLKITNRISFARIKSASDQFWVKNRPHLKLNFRLGLCSNRSWYEAHGVSYGLFFLFFWRHLWMGGHNFAGLFQISI